MNVSLSKIWLWWMWNYWEVGCDKYVIIQTCGCDECVIIQNSAVMNVKLLKSWLTNNSPFHGHEPNKNWLRKLKLNIKGKTWEGEQKLKVIICFIYLRLSHKHSLNIIVKLCTSETRFVFFALIYANLCKIVETWKLSESKWNSWRSQLPQPSLELVEKVYYQFKAFTKNLWNEKNGFLVGWISWHEMNGL